MSTAGLESDGLASFALPDAPTTQPSQDRPPRRPSPPIGLNDAREAGGTMPSANAPSAPPAASDITKAPKWADITKKPEFLALDDATKRQAKEAYFDHWIAPHAGGDRDTLRQQFLDMKDGPGLIDQAKDVLTKAGTNMLDVLKPTKPLMEGASTPQGQRSTVPVRPEMRAAFNAQWDAATPEQRQQIAALDDWRGQLARERDASFAKTPDAPTAAALDPRAEARRARLVKDGLDPTAAAGIAPRAARAGILPGQEVSGSVQESTYDFDTKNLFDPNQGANGLNNPLARGVAKGGLGLGKAVSGYTEFVGDVLGIDGMAESGKRVGGTLRGKEQAIGERGDFMSRNVEGAISSITQQLPLLLAGVSAGQAVPLAGMAFQSFGQEYSDGKARGQDAGQAAARAGIFAAFEVIGEKFGLGETLQALKGAAKGMPTDQIAAFLWSALKKEVPGELLTTTGQFGTDKFAPGGVGLTPDATGADYLKQVGDTIAQTILQSGMMAGGTTGASAAVRFFQERDAAGSAEGARASAMDAWKNGLAGRPAPEAAVTPDGRVELTPQAKPADSDAPIQLEAPAVPAPAPAPVQPGQQQEPAAAAPTPSASADQIVRELAQEAGIPLEMVLPSTVGEPGQQVQPGQAVDPQAEADVVRYLDLVNENDPVTRQRAIEVAVSNPEAMAIIRQEIEKAAEQDAIRRQDEPVAAEPVPEVPFEPARPEAPGIEEVSDQDVLNFARTRLRRLREQQRGSVDFVPGIDGVITQEIAPTGLSSFEASELRAIQAAGNDAATLRQFYGLAPEPTVPGQAGAAQVAEGVLPADQVTAATATAKAEFESAMQRAEEGAAAERARAAWERQPADGPGPTTVRSTTTAHPRVPADRQLSVGALAQVVEERLAQFRHQPPIVIRDSVDEVDLRGASENDGSVTSGMTMGGRVFLFRDGITDTGEAVRTLWHELLHYGLRRFLNQGQYIAEMQRLYGRDAWIKAKADAWAATDEASDAKAQGSAYALARGVDEALAELAETNEGGYRNTGVVATAKRAVLKWLAEMAERLGFHEWATAYRSVSHDEARDLVREIFGKLRDDAPAASRDGDFPAEPSFRRTLRRAADTLDEIGVIGNAMHTQKRKAELMPAYGRVWRLARGMQAALSRTANRAAELAPGLLPKIDSPGVAFKTLLSLKSRQQERHIAAQALFAGTTNGQTVLEGKVWTREEFAARFGDSEAAWGLYQQARAAIDASLDEVAAAEAFSAAHGLLAYLKGAVREETIDDPRSTRASITNHLERATNVTRLILRGVEDTDDRANPLRRLLETQEQAIANVKAIFERAEALKAAGYAPLMRFGRYVVTVRAIDPESGELQRGADGQPITLERHHFETEGEARFAKGQLEAKYVSRDDAGVSWSKTTDEKYQLYSGVSPETIAMFGDILGEQEATERLIQAVVSERSVMKRLLERKNTPGWSEDIQRTLATFITSNARYASQKLFMREIRETAHFMEQGDAQTEAKRLITDVLQSTDDAGSGVSTAAFTWFIGGNIGSAITQLFQVPLQTFPELVFRGGHAQAAKHLTAALPYALGKKEITDKDLRDALKRASQLGVVEAQEIYHLYSAGARNFASWAASRLAAIPGAKNTFNHASSSAQVRLQAFGNLWGSMFAMGESLNRRVSFIAAYTMAREAGDRKAFETAVDVVDNTQGIFDKINRPNVARGAVGRTLLIFQQFKIAYLEQMGRYLKAGGPEGRRALLMMGIVMLMAAGEEGLPFILNIEDVATFLARWAGYHINVTRTKREMVEDLLREALAIGFDDQVAQEYARKGRNLFMYGLSSLTPFDMQRLGMGRILPTQWMTARTPSELMRGLVEIAGPVGGLGQQVQNAMDRGADEGFLAGLKEMAPTAIANAAKGASMWETGEYRNSRGAKVGEVTKTESVLKGIGLQPQSIASTNRGISALMKDVTAQKDMQAQFLHQYAVAVRDDDRQEQDKIMSRIDAWNRRNPELEIYLQPEAVRRAVWQLHWDAKSRAVKATPRRMRGSLGLDSLE
jgi:hypothetical protein